jgi:kinesin family protein 4/21/27
MTGLDLDGDPSDVTNGMGIIPRSIAEIFDRINRLKLAKRDVWKATVKGSFIEIYNEDLIDLLSSEDPNMRRDVQIREDKEGNILWEGLREVPVKTVSDVMK